VNITLSLKTPLIIIIKRTSVSRNPIFWKNRISKAIKNSGIGSLLNDNIEKICKELNFFGKIGFLKPIKNSDIGSLLK
jgi:hypothetical protein